ncbi:MAG: hypothetical protein ATN36_08895 [Epulopiscium sp. Nele67-Bin005]|nr:MAG: hypothetical protein ATN36_08895 [Epulopiscium sp. Nele67-Bin005]
MQQYECSNCGYDITGIESQRDDVGLNMALVNNVDSYLGDLIIPFACAPVTNSISCPNCGQIGSWLKNH